EASEQQQSGSGEQCQLRPVEIGTQRPLQVRWGAITLCGVAGQRLQADRIQPPGNAPIDLPWRNHLAFTGLVPKPERVRILIGRLGGEHFIEYGAQAKYIAMWAYKIGLAARLLGGHVLRRAADASVEFLGLGTDWWLKPGKAEIEQPRLTGRID